MLYHVYILASATGVLYVGVTRDLERRIAEHRRGERAGFTREHAVHRLVYFEGFQDVRNAIAREKQLKGWRREKKIWLIRRENPGFADLSEGFGANLIELGGGEIKPGSLHCEPTRSQEVNAKKRRGLASVGMTNFLVVKKMGRDGGAPFVLVARDYGSLKRIDLADMGRSGAAPVHARLRDRLRQDAAAGRTEARPYNCVAG